MINSDGGGQKGTHENVNCNTDSQNIGSFFFRAVDWKYLRKSCLSILYYNNICLLCYITQSNVRIFEGNRLYLRCASF